MRRLEGDNILFAAATIAEMDGISVLEVFNRGADDLAIRVALLKIKNEK